MEEYNRLIASKVLDTYEDAIHHLPQPTMFGGKRARNFVLAGSTDYDYPASLAVGDLAHSRTLGEDFWSDGADLPADVMNAGSRKSGFIKALMYKPIDAPTNRPFNISRKVNKPNLDISKMVNVPPSENLKHFYARNWEAKAPARKAKAMAMKGIRKSGKLPQKGLKHYTPPEPVVEEEQEFEMEMPVKTIKVKRRRAPKKEGGKKLKMPHLSDTQKAFGRVFTGQAKQVGTKAGKPFEVTSGINPFTLGYDIGYNVIGPAVVGKGIGRAIKKVADVGRKIKKGVDYTKDAVEWDIKQMGGMMAPRSHLVVSGKPPRMGADGHGIYKGGRGKMKGEAGEGVRKIGGVVLRDNPAEFHHSVDKMPPALASYRHSARPMSGGARSARGAIVSKVMREMGLSLPEASKYVKANGLY